MKTRNLATALVALSIAASAVAQVPAPAGKDPSKVEAGSYAVEPMHTRILFSVDHMGFSTYYGQFTGASGTLTLDPKKVAASTFDVTVPTSSVATLNDKLDSELKSADWLDASKFSTIEFKATKVVETGKESAQVTGDFTLHGVTKPLTLTAKLHGNGANPMSKKATIGFDLTGKLKRSDYGVTKYVPLVGDEVDIIISAAFEKQG